ncbi:hypothetical protein DMW20_11790 [Vibrio parahaemolyticus]|nr:hypothetical protein [Vibrio parahaemolyticus]
MNPNSPMSYYQLGAVTVTNGSKTVIGYKTEWETTKLQSKPVVGSVFTIDQSNFYIVDSIVDDETITLNKEYRGPSNTRTSYLLMNQLSFDITDDDKITAGDLIEAAGKAVDKAKDWAIKMDGPVDPTSEYSSKYHATKSKEYAESAEADKNIAEDAATNAAESESKAEQYKNEAGKSSADAADSAKQSSLDASQVASDKADVDQKASEVASNASQVAKDKQETDKNAKYVHDLTVGPNPPSQLETPSDTNNAYYYFQQVFNLASGAISFNNKFTPSTAKEYPDKTPTSGLWLIETADLDKGYTFSTGSMKGYTCYTGDWFVYYKNTDKFEALFVSPLHQRSIPLANEDRAGIAEVATIEEAMAGVDDERFITPAKLAAFIQESSWKQYAQSEANMKAMRTLASNEFAASGFVHYGKHASDKNAFPTINEGMWQTGLGAGDQNLILIGGGSSSSYNGGTSKTTYPVTTIAGFVSNILHIGTTTQDCSAIKFPEAPDGTVTYNKATGAVNKHPDTTTAFDYANTSADIEVVINRVDMFGFEYFLEEVTEVFPYGCIQSKATTIEGIATKDSTRPDTYFAVFDGDITSKGKCVVWDDLTKEQKAKIVSNPDHNLFLMNDGRLVQWRVRQRTVAGIGNGDWSYLNPAASGTDASYISFVKGQNVRPQGIQDTVKPVGSGWGAFATKNSGNTWIEENQGIFQGSNTGKPEDATIAVDGECYFLVCGVVPRLNQGAYHPSFNPMGAKRWNTTTTNAAGEPWYGAISLVGSSISDCFKQVDAKTDSTTKAAAQASGNIGTYSGRPDNKFYDAIYSSGQGGVIDYRLSAWDMSSKEEASKIFQKVVNGSYRGKEQLVETRLDFFLSASASNASIHHANGRIVSYDDVVGFVADTANFGVGTTEVLCWNVTKNLDYSQYLAVYNGDLYCITRGVDAGDKMMLTVKTNIPASGDFTQVDVIGSPSEILATPDLANGWLGGWVAAIPPSAPAFYATRKALKVPVLRQYTTNNGASWSSDSEPLFDMTWNGRKGTYAANQVTLWTYTAFAKQTKSSSNKKVLNGSEGVGDVWASADNFLIQGNGLIESLLGKVGKDDQDGEQERRLSLTSHFFTPEGNLKGGSGYQIHSALGLQKPLNDSSAVKALWYQTATNDQVGLNFAYNELKYKDGVENPWGDTVAGTKYSNPHGQVRITDGKGTYVNLNGDTCLYGSNELAIPYGYIKNKARAGKQVAGVDFKVLIGL